MPVLLASSPGVERPSHFSADESAHIGGGGKLLCLRGESFHLSSGDSSDALLDLRNERRRQAQFVNPKADEQTCRDRIGGRFAAHPDVPALLVRGPSNSRNQAQDGGMKSVMELR